MTRALPPLYLHVTRRSRVNAEYLFDGGDHRDTLALVVPGGRMLTDRGLTVATHTEHPEGAARIEAGWHPDALVIGPHAGRESLVNWGIPFPFRRPDGRLREGEHRGLNLHSWRGRSDGCLTAPGWWLKLAIHELKRRGYRYGVDGDRIGVLLDEPEGPQMPVALVA